LEQFWPVGQAADNLRALISRSYSVKDENEAKKLMRRLDGTYEPQLKKNQVNKKIWLAKLRAFFK